MSNNIVRCIYIDNNGHKWIGTSQGGISVFDGSGWTVFNEQNSGLPDNYVNTITSDNQGVIWVGSSSGLTAYNGSNWTTYDISNSGLEADNVVDILIDDDGLIWVATDGGGLVTFNGVEWQNLNQGLHDLYLSSICLDGNGSVWAGTWNEGIGYFNGSGWTFYNASNSPLSDNYINSITLDSNGSKWISTKFGGINVFNEQGVPNSIPDMTDFSLSVHIYPNPVIDYLIIDDEQFSGNYYVRIYNLQGVLLKEQIISESDHSINVSEFSSGPYIVYVKSDTLTRVIKMIKY